MFVVFIFNIVLRSNCLFFYYMNEEIEGYKFYIIFVDLFIVNKWENWFRFRIFWLMILGFVSFFKC